jgi:hypothetical protein
VVNQGQVAVVKAFVGLATEDTSGIDFKSGSLVRPGHRGIWEEPLRTRKYAINPRVYALEIVPTFILTLNWADETSTAHSLDKDLSRIEAKSSEGFVFMIDPQVQIRVPDSDAPRVISTVGTMGNLVNEVLRAAVGNHFRDKLRSMPAIDFIQKRAEAQQQAVGAGQAALINVAKALANGTQRFMPENLAITTGGGGDGLGIGPLVPRLMRLLQRWDKAADPASAGAVAAKPVVADTGAAGTGAAGTGARETEAPTRWSITPTVAPEPGPTPR